MRVPSLPPARRRDLGSLPPPGPPGTGAHSGSATPVSAGIAELTLKVDGAHLAGTPVNIRVLGGQISTDSTLASGPGLTVATAGVASQFTLRERDEHRNPLLGPARGGGGADGQLGGYYASLGSIISTGSDGAVVRAVPDGSAWTISITPTSSGPRPLSVLRSGRHIAGSPFTLNVASGNVCAAACLLTGGGVTLATAGVTAGFTITARDAFSNVVSLQPPFAFTAFVVKGTQTVPRGGAGPVGQGGQVVYSATAAGESRLETSLATAGGLSATYYSDGALSVPLSADDLVVTVDWSSPAGSLPSWLGGASPITYSARWSGLIGGVAAGVYTFWVPLLSLAERVRLWVDNSLLIDQWSSLSSLSLSAAPLSWPPGVTGGFAKAVLELSDDNPPPTGIRGASFQWSHSGAPVAVPVPTASLFTAYAVPAGAGLSVRPGGVCAAASSLAGAGLSVATAGVAARLTVTARDAYANVVTDTVRMVLGDVDDVGGGRPRGQEVEGGGGESVYAVTISGGYALSASLLLSGGVQATYYSATDFGMPLAAGRVPSLGDVTGGALPACLPSLQYFSVRWCGMLNASPGVYTFSVPEGALARLIIDGETVLDSGPESASPTTAAARAVAGGEWARLELRHATGPLSETLLSWRGPASPAAAAIPTAVWSYAHPVQGTPFSVLVLPGRVCASASSIAGAGLTLATAGLASAFRVLTRDAFGNALSTATTVCTTSASCASGTSLGVASQYVSTALGGPSVDVPLAYVSNGRWDALVSGLTVSGSYRVDVFLPVVGGVTATYYAYDVSLESPGEWGWPPLTATRAGFESSISAEVEKGSDTSLPHSIDDANGFAVGSPPSLCTQNCCLDTSCA